MVKKFLKALCAISFVSTCLCGCTTGSVSESEDNSDALTMIIYNNGSHAAFEEALKEAYPDIEIEFIKYGGYDSTDYTQVQLETGEVADIYISTVLPPDDLQANALYDLSGEEFLSNLSVGILRNVTVDGAVYLIPTNYSFIGIYYNATLFEENGWEVPTSFEELEALIPQIEAAGVTLSECCTQYPGAGFAWVFDMAAGDFTTTLEGQQWMNDFLDGEATATGNFDEAVEILQKWIDCGMLNIGETPSDDSATKARFQEGNTAFLIINGSFQLSENSDGTGDQYGIMPFLSEDGSNNIIVSQVSTYYGISKDLEDDPEKLEKALQVLEFITTEEGMSSLSTSSSTISPIADNGVDESSPLYSLIELMDNGQSMELIYVGWEDYFSAIGNAVYDVMAGEADASEILTVMDEVQASGGTIDVATVEETLTLEETATVVGIAFAKAADADCALLSIGDFHGHDVKNSYGVNGQMFAGEGLNESTICTFNPLGWYGTVHTMEMTGAQIKQAVEDGFIYDGSDPDDEPYPYVLVTKDGEELDDDTVYTVACGYESQANQEAYNYTDTGLVGQDVLLEFFTEIGTVTKDTLVWSE